VSNPRIRVLAADDQRVVREGLAMLLGLLPDVEVVGTAADGEEALALAGELRPDVILMDLRMPRVDGVEATRRLRASHPEIKVVVLTTYADDRSVLDALRAGALGYLTKDAGADEIRQALQRVASGQASLDRPCRCTWSKRSPPRPPPPTPLLWRSCPMASRPAKQRY
jgi:DNA-binding NarL/FixJ family response regulator